MSFQSNLLSLGQFRANSRSGPSSLVLENEIFSAEYKEMYKEISWGKKTLLSLAKSIRVGPVESYRGLSDFSKPLEGYQRGWCLREKGDSRLSGYQSQY